MPFHGKSGENIYNLNDISMEFPNGALFGLTAVLSYKNVLECFCIQFLYFAADFLKCKKKSRNPQQNAD